MHNYEQISKWLQYISLLTNYKYNTNIGRHNVNSSIQKDKIKNYLRQKEIKINILIWLKWFVITRITFIVSEPLTVQLFVKEQPKLLKYTLESEQQLTQYLDATLLYSTFFTTIKKRIFSYSGVVHIESKKLVCPVFEMLTCNHVSYSILLWLHAQSVLGAINSKKQCAKGLFAQKETLIKNSLTEWRTSCFLYILRQQYSNYGKFNGNDVSKPTFVILTILLINHTCFIPFQKLGNFLQQELKNE